MAIARWREREGLNLSHLQDVESVCGELINRIKFINQQMVMIEKTSGQSGLTIHAMADLERYADTLKNLSNAYALLSLEIEGASL